MADQGWSREVQDVTEPGQFVGAGPARADRLMKGQARGVQGLKLFVDGIMVAVEQIQSFGDTRLDRSKGREIVAGLDPMMTIEMAEKAALRLDQARMDCAGVKGALTDQLTHHRLLATKAVVHLQPEACGLGQGGVGPGFAGAIDQQTAHRFGQARTRLQGQVRQGRWSLK